MALRTTCSLNRVTGLCYGRLVAIRIGRLGAAVVVQTLVQVELEGAVQRHVRSEQRGESALVVDVHQQHRPRGLVEDPVDQAGVDQLLHHCATGHPLAGVRRKPPCWA